jgi:hypothetical protein
MTLLLAALLPALATGPADADAVKLPVPNVEYRTNEATASRSPWIDANGWQLLREPTRRYCYDAPSASVAIAAAEAIAYAAKAEIHTDASGAAISIACWSSCAEFRRSATCQSWPTLA